MVLEVANGAKHGVKRRGGRAQDKRKMEGVAEH